MKIVITSAYFKLPQILERGSALLKWRDRDGNSTAIPHLKSSHIRHIINCFEGKSKNIVFQIDRSYYGVPGKVWVRELKKEANFRRSMGWVDDVIM